MSADNPFGVHEYRNVIRNQMKGKRIMIPSIENIVRLDFLKYLDGKENQISLRTKQRYLSDINKYVENYIIKSNIIDGLDKFFVTRDIELFLNNRRSSTARATIVNFMNFLKEYGHLSPLKYIELSDYLKSLKPTKIEKQMKFFYDEELAFLLGSKIHYGKKDTEEAKIHPSTNFNDVLSFDI
jgi:hypothetical protein